MARLALILHGEVAGRRELDLRQLLDFFGVPCELVSLSDLEAYAAGNAKRGVRFALFGPVQDIAALQSREKLGTCGPIIESAEALYMYPSDNPTQSSLAFQALSEDSIWALDRGTSPATVKVAGDYEELTGPMTGLQCPSYMTSGDWVLVPAGKAGGANCQVIVSANEAPVFVRFQLGNVPCCFCTSTEMVDIDQAVGQGFYDIKEHFCSTVPLVMFIRWAFAEVCWQPQELGACLIIDDPLLKSRYGCCDFSSLANLMKHHGFTTNIAFIPWNWRRTSRKDSAFFRREADHFSISIHGCDHTGGEFGTPDTAELVESAELAQSRMRLHQARSAIRHEPVMVFPQGVFSARCPAVLKRTHFVAAV